MKVINLILFIGSIAGILFSSVLIIMGNQPCSGDGCMIHFLYLAGALSLFISGIVFFFTYRNIRKFKSAKAREKQSAGLSND